MNEPKAATEAAGGDLSGRTLGEFQLIRQLGKGGMAEVYLAKQTSLNRQVAVKVMRPESTGNVLRKRFEREAKAAAKITHPNIVQVYAFGEEDGLLYIVQEYVQGLTLKDYIKKKGPPDPPLAVHFMRQVTAALRKAAAEGVVHRDIKPENIMIAKKGVAKVADFGLAMLTQPEQDGKSLDLTEEGTTMGTPMYMSPEQVSGRKLDARSDIYSFGVTCYHLLTGDAPFRGETAMSVAVMHLNDEPQPLQEQRADLPPALCQIVHKMMAKEPKQRYESADELAKDLKQLFEAMKGDGAATFELTNVDVGITGARRSLPARIERWSTAGKVWSFLGMLILIGGIGAGLGWWLRPKDPRKQPPAMQSKIKQMASADEQLELVKVAHPNDVYAWEALIQQFPEDKAVNLEAKSQLALLHLKELRLEQADELFQELSRLTGSRLHDEFASQGIAGKAVIASLQGDHAAAKNLIENQLEQRTNFDYGSTLGLYVQEAKEHYRAAPDAQPEESPAKTNAKS